MEVTSTVVFDGTYALNKTDDQTNTYEDSATWKTIINGTKDIIVDFSLYLDLLFDNDSITEYVFIEVLCFDTTTVELLILKYHIASTI